MFGFVGRVSRPARVALCRKSFCRAFVVTGSLLLCYENEQKTAIVAKAKPNLIEFASDKIF
jgi:hypothetical protein